MTIARERNARGSGEQLREQLIAAANDLLVRPQRLSVPSLRAVARACGVSPAAVYLHFDSVEALILAVIEAQYDDLGASLAAAREGMMPGPELLIAAGLGYAEWGLAHPGAYQLLFESADELQLATTVDLEGARGWDLIEELAGEVARSTRPSAISFSSAERMVSMSVMRSLDSTMVRASGNSAAASSCKRSTPGPMAASNSSAPQCGH